MKSPSTNPRRGRPHRLNTQLETLVVAAIERGLPLREAASLAGISYDTLNRWKQDGSAENASPRLQSFAAHLARAQAVAVDTLLTKINQASERGDWKAAAWILERRHPETWGRQRVEHTGANGAPITTITMTPEDGRQFISDASLKELVLSTLTGDANE